MQFLDGYVAIDTGLHVSGVNRQPIASLTVSSVAAYRLPCPFRIGLLRRATTVGRYGLNTGYDAVSVSLYF
ncbi:hypothetical protein SAMN04515672_4216 [Natronorubrum texcoconense]|uniref:Uncharacterized protein n=1 Tax=Natronorubrum texcoconense TaxID=1095776 RepID=A0A1G9FPB1_9EURY|nr:hypothetical protein SAMN04515672_4216 [Natronorubrum texcoconense]